VRTPRASAQIASAGSASTTSGSANTSVNSSSGSANGMSMTDRTPSPVARLPTSDTSSAGVVSFLRASIAMLLVNRV
jgi:hypothetical protein